MIYQTCFDDMPELKKNGCLLSCLNRIAELETGKETSIDQFVDTYNKLNNKRVLSKDLDYFSESGAFVHDHVAAINEFLSVLGSNKKACYKMRHYMPNMKGYGSFGLPNYDMCNYLIFQVQTANGGHFRMFDYDPWEHGTETRYIKSVRGYLIK